VNEPDRPSPPGWHWALLAVIVPALVVLAMLLVDIGLSPVIAVLTVVAGCAGAVAAILLAS
jgi:hypothetical protein